MRPRLFQVRFVLIRIYSGSLLVVYKLLSFCLLLLVKVRNRLLQIILNASAIILSLSSTSAASLSSKTSIISIKHSFLSSLSSISFLESEKSAIWCVHALDLAMKMIAHLLLSQSATIKQLVLPLKRGNFFNSILTLES